MFTGLVQDVGTVTGLRREGGSVHIALETRLGDELGPGDSLAVSGVCLTVTRCTRRSAVATAIPETLSRTNLGALSVGDRVNLEPALRAGDRMGGHIVQGHVDGAGHVRQARQRGLSLELSLDAPGALLRYVVEKGSIAIDGVSLTVASVSEVGFSVALVPHTLGVTTLEHLRPGDRVNLEVDILAKYVERLLSGHAGTPDGGDEMDEEYLRRHGFA